jgi:hypothetical protein
MIKIKYYKPIGLPDMPKKYWITAICMGCYKPMNGLGILIEYYWPIHINLICLIRFVKHYLEIRKHRREYFEDLWRNKK